MGFDAVIMQQVLERIPVFAKSVDSVRRNVLREAGGGEQARHLPDVPFRWVQAIAAVRNVRGSDIFAGGNQVFHADGNQRAQRNLEWQAANVYIIVAACGRDEGQSGTPRRRPNP